MKIIKITNQAEFDALPLQVEESTRVEIVGDLNSINKLILNSVIYVYGSAKIGSVYGSARIDYIYGSARIDYIYGSARIDYIYGSAKIGSVYGSAKIGSVYGSASIDYVYGSAKIGSVSDSAKIGSVSGSAKIGSVYGAGSVNIYNESSVFLFGFAVAWLFNKAATAIKKSDTAVIIKVNYNSKEEAFFYNNPVEISGDNVILYKRVSKDFKTQENTKNETVWTVGRIIEHPNWNPAKEECGEGKYHACAKPIFCNGYRNIEGDRYIAIQVCKQDLYAWETPNHPRKISFRKGVVLYECDEDGVKIG